MMKKRTGRAPSLIKSVAAGAALGTIWTVVCAAIIAKLLDSQILAMEKVGYGAMVTVLSAVFMGASLAGKRAGHMVVQASLLSAVAYFACLLLVNVLFFGGSYAGLGVTALLVLLSAALAILVAGKGMGRPRRQRYKIPKG